MIYILVFISWGFVVFVPGKGYHFNKVSITIEWGPRYLILWVIGVGTILLTFRFFIDARNRGGSIFGDTYRELNFLGLF